MLVAHFAPAAEPVACGHCDVCRGESPSHDSDAEARAERAAPAPLPDAARDLIVAAVGRLTRPVGKSNLARALRGSRAKALSRGGLLQLPEYGALAEHAEAEIVAAIEGLLAEGKLRRTGQKYPTLWLPGKPIRGAAGGERDDRRGPPKRTSRYGGPVARALDNYRRRQARVLKWKAYMVFQRRAMLAIDREEPTTREALARIPGLGPAKIERFGDDILALVRQHGSRSQS
jgi:ATP-dependent DNA helicase RecQ